LKVMCIK